MRYFLFREQSGGCDYTIGCGYALDELEADTLETAIVEATWFDEEDPGESWIETEGDMAIDTAQILEVARVHDINLNALAAARRKEAAQKAQAEKLQEERATYERLKKKFAKRGE